ncbi:hypothetical protein EDB89DRAFT_1364139 [Lactarius sanguifluus]|nr:hypothetical protein EDB89DRAFT_1364139 [Lactarius sanguifluus]
MWSRYLTVVLIPRLILLHLHRLQFVGTQPCQWNMCTVVVVFQSQRFLITSVSKSLSLLFQVLRLQVRLSFLFLFILKIHSYSRIHTNERKRKDGAMSWVTRPTCHNGTHDSFGQAFHTILPSQVTEAPCPHQLNRVLTSATAHHRCITTLSGAHKGAHVHQQPQQNLLISKLCTVDTDTDADSLSCNRAMHRLTEIQRCGSICGVGSMLLLIRFV